MVINSFDGEIKKIDTTSQRSYDGMRKEMNKIKKEDANNTALIWKKEGLEQVL